MNRTARKIIMAAAVSVFLFSSFMFLKQYLELRGGAEYSERISKMAVDLPKEHSENDDLIQVDFDLLREQNQDIAAWIYCPDTPINYPVVQGSDNEFYLNRLLDGSKNSAGTLFMDYRNAGDLSDWNSIIYGHNMKNDSMFGILSDYKDQSYYESHPVMYLFTPEQDYKINLLAGFVTSANSELYRVFDPNEEDKDRFIQNWLDGSDFHSEIDPAVGNRLVTLSTCSYEYSDARYVLVGVLELYGDKML